MTESHLADGPSTADTNAAPAQPSPAQFLLLVVVAGVVGLVAAAAASGYYWLQHETSTWLWETVPKSLGATSIPWWWILTVLLVGAVAVWGARQLPGDGGHLPLHGFGLDIGPGQILSVALAGFATLVSGAVLGPEAPLIAIGTAIGALALRRAQGPVVKVMMLAGGMGAIGTIFGNPMITALLLLEGLVLAGGGAMVGMALIPVMFALACGYVVQTGIGSWPGLGHAQLSVPGLQPATGLSFGDLLGALVVGLVACIATAIAREIGERVQVGATRRPLPTILASAVVVALLAIVVVGVSGQNVQVILFSGETGIPFMLGQTSVGTVLLILAAKLVAYGVSLGGGWRAGPVFPSAFLGVTVGVLAALLVPSLGQTVMVAAGIAAASAFTMRLVVTGSLLGVLLTSAAGAFVTPVAIIGAVVGVLARRALDTADRKAGRDVAPMPGGGM